jgi:Fur family peroxide stress response transcriptional regulator
MVYPKISLGTVYRNLTLLSETGEILRLRLGDGVDHFDADTSEHYHVLCNGCGIVEDLDMKGKKLSIDTSILPYDGTITGHIIYFKGICKNCNQKDA